MARICSRWDWQRLEYDYFEAEGLSSPGGWKPLTGLGAEGSTVPSGRLGVSIEDALPPLPVGAILVGHGKRARGQLVRPVKADDEALAGDQTPEHRGEGTVALGFLLGLGVTLTMPLPAAVPVFLAGGALGYEMGKAQRRQEALSGLALARVRQVFKVKRQ